ncbi:hypothetical protein BS50DRAFT_586889 [Corynespora cassiicola Philippines]|uniref:F-box domain-containing protein n=1 Tax=Corynespora cassiicola Philippines TaxID=1448308 RepID=A0A2T2NQT6_CORCC|nr:hypothetical protein BS50DRAFT_586889 [Corynespora cassiicola Philippines]
MSSDQKPCLLALFPDEIKLRIFGYAFRLKHGIDAVRWPIVRRLRFDIFLQQRGIAHLVPEVLYTNNTLHLWFEEVRGTNEMRISYPPAIVGQHLRRIEVNLRPMQSGFYRSRNYHTLQISFLRKLGKGSLGFSRLESVRLIVGPSEKPVDLIGQLTHFLDMLEIDVQSRGKLQNPASDFDTLISQHSCKLQGCLHPHDTDSCQDYLRMMSFFHTT